MLWTLFFCLFFVKVDLLYGLPVALEPNGWITCGCHDECWILCYGLHIILYMAVALYICVCGRGEANSMLTVNSNESDSCLLSIFSEGAAAPPPTPLPSGSYATAWAATINMTLSTVFTTANVAVNRRSNCDRLFLQHLLSLYSSKGMIIRGQMRGHQVAEPEGGPLDPSCSVHFSSTGVFLRFNRVVWTLVIFNCR